MSGTKSRYLWDFLELPQNAASLYSAQIPAEKRKLLNLLYSNSAWVGGERASTFIKPFNCGFLSGLPKKKGHFPGGK